jgi:hypothetical protein
LIALFTLALWAVPGSSASSALAPGQPEFVEHRRALEVKLQQLEAVHVAVSRIHNALGSLLSDPKQKVCDSDFGRSLIARSRLFGTTYRDAAQSARMEADRVRFYLVAPTVAPLIPDDDRSEAVALLERTETRVRAYLEAQAWQNRFVEPLGSRCTLPLSPVEGLAGVGPNGATDGAPIAVIGIGNGRICPGNVPADGRVRFVFSAKACYGGPDCACEPRPVLPGAVLGPPPTPP